MNKTIKFFSLLSLVLLMFSCEVDEVLEDPRDDYVGQWDYNDEILSKDYTSVGISIDPNSEDKIVIFNFANLGEDLLCSVNGKSLTITQSSIGGLDISGIGSADYKIEEIELTSR